MRDVIIRGPLYFTRSMFQRKSLSYLGIEPIEVTSDKLMIYKVDAELIYRLNSIADNVRYIWSGVNN